MPPDLIRAGVHNEWNGGGGHGIARYGSTIWVVYSVDSAGVFARSRTAGGVWSDEEVVLADTVTVINDPVVCVDSQGDVHVAWTGATVGYAKRVAGVWGAPVTLQSTSASVPSIAIAPDDTVWLAWTDMVSSPRVVKAAYSGPSWTTETVLEGTWPCIAVDSAGIPHVVSQSPDKANILYSTRATTWSVPVLLPGVGVSYHFEPAIAVDAAGRPHVVFDTYSPANITEIWYSTLDGAAWRAPVAISTDPSNVSSEYADIAISDDGDLHVAWMDPAPANPTGPSVVSFSTFDGVSWSPRAVLLAVDGIPMELPDIVGGKTGFAIVCMASGPTTDFTYAEFAMGPAGVPLGLEARGVAGISILKVPPPFVTAFPTVSIGTTPVPFTGGSVSVSMRQGSERNVSVTGVSLSAAITDAVGSGSYLRAYDAAGNALGVFCDLNLQREVPALTYSVTGEDLSRLASVNLWKHQPGWRYVNSGTPRDFIARMIHDAAPSIPIAWTWADVAEPVSTIRRDGDPWAAAQEVAIAEGLQLYVDEYGSARLRSVAKAVGGQALSGVTSINFSYSVRDAKNVIIGTSSQKDAERVVTVIDSTSEIAVSAIGRRVEDWGAPAGLTVSQLTEACHQKLEQYLSGVRSCGWSQIYSPGVRVNQIYNVEGTSYRAESLTIPLDPKALMTVNGSRSLSSIAAKLKQAATGEGVTGVHPAGGSVTYADFEGYFGGLPGGKEANKIFAADANVARRWIDAPTGGNGTGLTRGTITAYDAGAGTCTFAPDAGGVWTNVAIAQHVTVALGVPCWVGGSSG